MTEQSIEIEIHHREFVFLIIAGVVSGILAGLFGIGGGMVMIPILMALGMDQRHASATSMAAIIPISISGIIVYSIQGQINWAAAIAISVGMVIGAQIGSWFLSILPEKALRWFFFIFMVSLIIQQFLVVPAREDQIEVTIGKIIGMVVVGAVTGILASILGVGGGGMLVPAMIVFFDANDLQARGVSIFAMLPGAISATIANHKRRLVHVGSAMIIGLTAVVTTPIGTMLAKMASPQLNQYLFAGFLAIVVLRAAWSIKNTPKTDFEQKTAD